MPRPPWLIKFKVRPSCKKAHKRGLHAAYGSLEVIKGGRQYRSKKATNDDTECPHTPNVVTPPETKVKHGEKWGVNKVEAK
jgi:hypothetical protein